MQIANAAEELNKLTEGLQDIVSKFKLEDNLTVKKHDKIHLVKKDGIKGMSQLSSY